MKKESNKLMKSVEVAMIAFVPGLLTCYLTYHGVRKSFYVFNNIINRGKNENRRSYE